MVNVPGRRCGSLGDVLGVPSSLDGLRGSGREVGR
jgi:hypothetical protein